MKSKFLEVCKGNSLKIGKMILIMSFKLLTTKSAEFRVLARYTFPIPNVLAIL